MFYGLPGAIYILNTHSFLSFVSDVAVCGNHQTGVTTVTALASMLH